MSVFYSQPTLDLKPLEKDCLFELPETLDKSFVDEAMKVAKSLNYIRIATSHREYGESAAESWDDPNQIRESKLDPRTFIRQPMQDIKQEVGYAEVGHILDDAPLQKIVANALGDKAKYFHGIHMLELDEETCLLPHKDGSGTCRIYIPVWPLGMEYSRLEFYHNCQSYYLYNLYSPPKMYLFSSQVIHAVFNKGYPKRWNLQIKCKLPYDEAIKLWL